MTPRRQKLGIIDLGTNSVRFDVHEVGEDRRTRLLLREKLMVRLGENVFLDGRLAPAAAERTLQALLRFRRLANDLGAQRIVAFATSALREVEDSGPFVRRIERATGIRIRIISGEEEARLIATGVLAHLPKRKGKISLVDIGGGSTEISICRGGKLVQSASFPLGAARLQQVFLQSSPPPEGAVERLRQHIREKLAERLRKEKWPSAPRVVGSSGSIRAISRLVRKGKGHRAIRPETLGKLARRMETMTPQEILRLPGMEPKRIDLILAGTVLLQEIMEAVGAKEATPTPYALRDGILLEEIQRLRAEKTPAGARPDLFPLYVKARRLGSDEAHLRQLVGDAELLFDALQPLHRLGPAWRSYLLMAVLFRDSGWSVSPVDHEKHSYYIVKHADLPLAEPWETEVVARLCLHHEKGKGNLSALPFKGPKRERARRSFEVLLALLRLVDALDPVHQEKASARRVSLDGKEVSLLLSKGPAAELARLRLEQKKELFEEVFRRKLVVEIATH